MRSLAALAISLIPALALAEAGGAPAPDRPAARGAATYLARIATPPGAVFEATLADVSRADAPATTVGRVVLRDAAGPPFAFAIPFDPAALAPGARLAVRATLAAQGRFLFATDTVHAVDPVAPDVGEIAMVPVNAPLGLTGPKWVLAAMGEREIAAADFMREPPNLTFGEDGRAHGSGGCNRIATGYAAGASGALFVDRGAMTMMACPDPAMEIEAGFAAMLEAVDGWRIEDGRLVLEAAGAPLATFVATDP